MKRILGILALVLALGGALAAAAMATSGAAFGRNTFAEFHDVNPP